MGRCSRVSLLLVALAASAAMAAPAEAAQVEVGVGRADITPLTGGYKGGWACACAKALGQHTRLYARAVVIKSGGQKVALVAEDLSFVGGGMIEDAASLLPGRGFTAANIIDSATHTHGSQTGFMNFGAYNSVLPKANAPTQFNLSDTDADQTMYSFMTRQLAKAIRRADSSLHPGAVGWGHADLLGVTENRSLEAHLANFGIDEPVGTGNVNQDPDGYAGTIDPSVDVLRVDRSYRGHMIPIGMWSVFANHGTVVKPTFPYFTADHQGAAERVVESTIRRAGKVPKGQDVVNAFANGDGGDMSSGLHHSGPADAELIGRQEAVAMMKAWRRAGSSMKRKVPIEQRWTRICLCGNPTGDGPLDNDPVIGLAAAAGSEELRTVFFDTGVANEGARLPVANGAQGVKIPTLNESGDVPNGIPLAVVKIGDQAIASVPGEPTIGVGDLIRTGVANQLGSSIKRVVVTGFAGEYMSYVATPKEYDQQHYEGGFTLFGRTEALVIRDSLGGLAANLAAGAPAPQPYIFDPGNQVDVTSDDYGTGSATATATEQPSAVRRLEHVAFKWTGGANGIDRPVDKAFVTIQRRAGKQWRTATDDLGMQIVWSVDDAGAYIARWEVPISAPRGLYRFRITAKRYTLNSGTFKVKPSTALGVNLVGANRLAITYPAPVVDEDWTYRPPVSRGGSATFSVNGKQVGVSRKKGFSLPVPAGASTDLAAGTIHDRFGNTNGAALQLKRIPQAQLKEQIPNSQRKFVCSLMPGVRIS